MTEITLDSWQPENKRPKLIPSKWRQEQNKDVFNYQPGLDELRKIKTAIKKKYPDHEIMECYGISAETLVAIKGDSYSAAEGLRNFYRHKIQIGKQTKMFLEFQRLEDMIYGLIGSIDYIGDVLFIDPKQRSEFKQIFSGKKEYSDLLTMQKEKKVKSKK